MSDRRDGMYVSHGLLPPAPAVTLLAIDGNVGLSPSADGCVSHSGRCQTRMPFARDLGQFGAATASLRIREEGLEGPRGPLWDRLEWDGGTGTDRLRQVNSRYWSAGVRLARS
jgi:hypothetical protein